MATYIQIASVTVGSGGAASIDFTSIPATYTDLLVKLSGRASNSAAGNSLRLKVNSITSGYSVRGLRGDGSAATSFTDSGATYFAGVINAATGTTSTFSNIEIYIPNYAGSTNKSISVDSARENNTTAADLYLLAGLLTNTAGITGLTLTCETTANFVEYSTATLYGISKS
jgi:hypothetical protein